MPNMRSAMKRDRKAAARRIINRSRKAALWTCEKKLRKAVAEGNTEAAQELLRQSISLYDKAAKVGTIHKNKADRKKSRLTKLVNPAPAAPAAEA